MGRLGTGMHKVGLAALFGKVMQIAILLNTRAHKYLFHTKKKFTKMKSVLRGGFFCNRKAVVCHQRITIRITSRTFEDCIVRVLNKFEL